MRDLIKGQNPIAKIAHSPFEAIAAGAQRSGFGSIVGDFLLSQFNRHGLSAAASMLGPTFGKIDDLAELLHAGGRTKEGMWSAQRCANSSSSGWLQSGHAGAALDSMRTLPRRIGVVLTHPSAIAAAGAFLLRLSKVIARPTPVMRITVDFGP